MNKPGYSPSTEPNSRGSAAPFAEALGTVPSTGRTGSGEPSQLLATDASTKQFKLTYFDPPAGLEKYVLTLFHFEWSDNEISDRHPGALGQLFITLRGQGVMKFEGRADRVQSGPMLFSGFDVATPFRMEGPWHAVGVSLSALGWAALTQAPANDTRNRLIAAPDLLGPEIEPFSSNLVDAYRTGSVSGAQCAAALAEWIAPRLGSVPAQHEDLIHRTMGWLGSSLNPDVERLFVRFDYSRRQVERLVSRYFGYSPAALSRKLRAIRAAHLLAQPDLTDEGEAEIAAAFYDQPHMIREIRRFCGYTPTRLGGAGEPLFQTMLRMRNLERLKEYRKIG